MLMGFNTDIKHDGVVYHVQTEPRKDGGFESTVFTRGAVIHRCKISCHDQPKISEPTDRELQHRLEEQHRFTIARIRSGEIRAAMPRTDPTSNWSPQR